MSPRSYIARPAKAIQRLMLAEAFRKLQSFGPLAEYRYVGFGAHEFVDFELMWRALGVTDMTSVEEQHPVDRYQFNAPFAGVRVLSGTAGSVLPNLTLSPHTIVWLDYTSRLKVPVINDVNGLVRRLGSGSVVVVTVNVQPEEKLAQRLSGAIARLGRARVPSTATDASFSKWGLADLSHQVLRDEAAEAMRGRADRASFEELFRFHYQDTTKMLTWGGVVVAPADHQTFEGARFEELVFGSRPARGAFLVNPPALTIREIVHLNRELPLTPGAVSPLAWISDDDFDDYARLQRWYPNLTA